MNRLKQWFLPFLIFLFLSIGIIYSVNAYRYTNHWAYDAWGHIQYIETLAVSHRFPTMQENYLAWHEPLYYILNAAIFYPFIAPGLTEGSSIIVKFLQYESAFLGLLFIAGAALLSWLVSKHKGVTIAVAMATAFLPELSEVSRFATNEMLFQTLTIWFVVLFWYWKLYDETKWTQKKWFLISCALSILLYTKLTGLIVGLAVLLWLALIAIREKRTVPLKMALVVASTTCLLFTPWLIYKQTHFGSFLTINTYEHGQNRERSHWMGNAFYTSWDDGIMTNPVWPAGTRSFWSMLYADTLGDYYNIFQHYEYTDTLQNDQTFQTVNKRRMSFEYKKHVLTLYRLSVPLFLITLFGFISFSLYTIVQFFKKKEDGTALLHHSHLFLVILAYGFLTSLMYNTYKYPNLEQGTMKAIFILSFFPFYWIIAMLGYTTLLKKTSSRTFIGVLFFIYLILWAFISSRIILLP